MKQDFVFGVEVRMEVLSLVIHDKGHDLDTRGFPL